MDSELKDIGSLRITPLDDEEESEEPMQVEPEVEDEDDDEDEDDEEEEGVLLGFAEKPKNPVYLLRHFFPSKAGGVPAWLDPVDLPSGKSRTCGFCEEPLQFLLQVYASLDKKESTFHRMLYVSMCPSMSCLYKDQHEQWKRKEGNPRRSVKVFRCQMPRSNPFYSYERPELDGKDKPLTGGAELCCWCGTWRGDKVCSSCRRARYCSEKHQVLHWRSGHKHGCHQIDSSSGSSLSISGNGADNLPSTGKVACKTLWPEYEIENEDECTSDTEKSEDDSSARSLIPRHDKSDETFQLLSDKFEGNADKKCWASFQQRIARAPEQVLRYSRDAKPLWPMSVGRPSKADIPKCIYCRGHLVYEFQIMPQLLTFFHVKNDPDSLDWATIVIYTCAASCEASVSYKEEFAWVQLYPTTSMA